MEKNSLLLSAKDAAELLGISRTYFYQLDASGRLGPVAIRLNTRPKWVRSEIVSWTESGCPNRQKWQVEKK